MWSLLVFHRAYRLEIQLVMLVFRPSFVNYCPSLTYSPVNLPPSSQCQSTNFKQTVCGWEVVGGGGGGGGWDCQHSLAGV
jgi:hypothetical protein